MPEPLILSINGHAPAVARRESWVAPNATVIGQVTLAARGPASGTARSCGPSSSPSRSARAPTSRTASRSTSTPAFPPRIGAGVSVGHNAVLHGCTVEDGCLIGMGAIVLNGAVIGAGSLVAAGAVVAAGRRHPAAVAGGRRAGKVRRELSDDEVASNRLNAQVYQQLSDVAPHSRFGLACRRGYLPTVKPMRILVTGATGYVGSRLVTALLARRPRGRRRQPQRRATRPTSAGSTTSRRSSSTPHDPESAAAPSAWPGPSTSSTTWCTASANPTSATPTTRAAANVAERREGRRRPAHRLPRRVRARGRRALRAPDQPGRGRRGADHRRRTRRGVARRGDHHRRRVDVVRDAALRRRPLPADPACRRGRTTRWTRSRSATCSTTWSPRPTPSGCRPGPTTSAVPRRRRTAICC